MATGDDLNANAEFVRLADMYVEVPSGSNKVSCAMLCYFGMISIERKGTTWDETLILLLCFLR